MFKSISLNDVRISTSRVEFPDSWDDDHWDIDRWENDGGRSLDTWSHYGMTKKVYLGDFTTYYYK